MKTVLITGASRGIGRAIALRFASEGYNIVLNYNTSEKQAMDLCKQIEKMGVKCLAVKADIANAVEVGDMVKEVLNKFGRIDVLVNNAGVSLYKLFQDCATDDVEKIFGVNTFGVINSSRAVVPSMISAKCGKIINISSIWGKVGASMETIYSASKGAVISLTLALAKELAPSGICVNCVCPGVIETDMLNSFSDQDKNELKNQTPLNRLGTPEDVADMVYFLASNSANFVTGQVIAVDGGFIL